MVAEWARATRAKVWRFKIESLRLLRPSTGELWIRVRRQHTLLGASSQMPRCESSTFYTVKIGYREYRTNVIFERAIMSHRGTGCKHYLHGRVGSIWVRAGRRASVGQTFCPTGFEVFSSKYLCLQRIGGTEVCPHVLLSRFW